MNNEQKKKEKKTNKQKNVTQERERMTFVCVGCRAPLFAATSEITQDDNANESDASFEKVLNFSSARASSTHSQPDHSFGLPRTKLSCAKCDAHLGHVFHAPNQLPDRVRFCVSASACELQTSPLSPSQLAPPVAAPATAAAAAVAAASATNGASSSSSSSLPSNAGATAASSAAAHRVAGMTQQAVAAKARREEQNSASTFMVGAAALALVGVAVVYLFRKSK